MMSAGTMASVNGNVMCTVVLCPGTLSISTVPPMSSMFVRTTSSPTPRPDRLVMVLDVEKPAAKTNGCSSSFDIVAPCTAVIKPR